MLRAAMLLTTIVLLTAPVLAQKQITLLATVTDSTDAPAASLDAARVNLTEDGNPMKVLKVEPVKRVSKLHLLVDTGVGLPPEALADLRKGLHGLVDALPDDLWVSLVTTSPQPRFIERGTAGRDKLHKAVDLIAPDNGSGRFAESLFEATDRIDRDRDSNNVIVSIATLAGDLQQREGDNKKILERLGNGRTRVHVVLYGGRVNTTAGGSVQHALGEAVAKNTSGRFELINVANRLATLLPELGGQVAKTMGGGARQFRITAERPKVGDMGRMSLQVTGMVVSQVVLETR
jgi:hypothetical protein